MWVLIVLLAVLALVLWFAVTWGDVGRNVERVLDREKDEWER